jgi:hypothetical protein
LGVGGHDFVSRISVEVSLAAFSKPLSSAGDTSFLSHSSAFEQRSHEVDDPHKVYLDAVGAAVPRTGVKVMNPKLSAITRQGVVRLMLVYCAPNCDTAIEADIEDLGCHAGRIPSPNVAAPANPE